MRPRYLVPLPLLVLWALAGLPAGIAAPDLPRTLSPADAAGRVVAAHARADTELLRALALRPMPDPWVVTRTLLTDNHADAAAAFVAAVPDKRRGRLAEELGAWKQTPERTANRARLDRGKSSFRAKRYREALSIWEGFAPGSAAEQVLLAWRKATAHDALREDEQAQILFRRCVEAAAKAGWSSMEAAARQRIARALGKRHAWQSMEAELEAAIAAGDRAEFGNQQALSWGMLASARERHGKPEQAIDAARHAVGAARTLRSRRELGRAYTLLGGLQWNAGHPTGALASHRAAQATYTRLGNINLTVLAMTNIGLVLKDMGRLDEAETLLSDALERSRSLSSALRRADILRVLGHVSDRRGQPARAIAHYRASLALMRELGNSRGVGFALSGLGRVLTAVGDYRGALEALDTSLAMAEKRGDRAAVALRLSRMAGVFQKQGDPDRALKAYDRALATRRALRSRRGIASTLVNRAVLLLQMGRIEEARVQLIEAARRKDELGDRPGKAIAEIHLASALARLGRFERARRVLSQALTAAERMGLLLAQLSAQHVRARIALATGDAAGALAASERTLALGRQMRAGLSEAHSLDFVDQLRAHERVGFEAARAVGNADAAFRFLEASRAAALLDALGGRDVVGREGIPANLRLALEQARSGEGRAGQELILALGAGDAAAADRAGQALSAARAQIQTVIEWIRERAAPAADVIFPKPLPLRAIQEVLAPHEAVLHFGLFDKRAYALVITSADTRFVELARPDALAEAVASVVFDAPPAWNPAGLERLRKRLIEPLALPASVKRVLVVPSGILTHLPFAALLPEREIAYLPSATTYVLLRQGCTRCGTGVLALGDPAYPPGAMAAGIPLRRLPYSREEARAIGDVVLLGAQATEQGLALALGRRTQWSALHLACHAVIHPEQPRASTLALTPGPRATTPEDATADEEATLPPSATDGRISVRDVFQMKIPCDLVVLSACESGLGRVRPAAGIVGFTRAFLFAGAPRVLVSLWRVDDEATSALMRKFYEVWNSKTDGKHPSTAAALQKAQAWMRSQERWHHAYYWAAWSLWGVPE